MICHHDICLTFFKLTLHNRWELFIQQARENFIFNKVQNNKFCGLRQNYFAKAMFFLYQLFLGSKACVLFSIGKRGVLLPACFFEHQDKYYYE
ncbi:MAG: hypothetical protein D3910_27100 [Candidatus Electrothrix sp. ATG2]|nr:hypothetical protein [Candidatus Electrothrix sp. ATG2]